MNTGPVLVPGTELLRPEWLGERIADMGISWGTGDVRVSGTLWWCMAASSLVKPIVVAYAHDDEDFDPTLEHLALEIRPDGGIEQVLQITPEAVAALASGTHPEAGVRLEPGVELEPGIELEPVVPEPAVASPSGEMTAAQAGACADRACDTLGWEIPRTGAGPLLRHTLSQVIPVVSRVSGAGEASLWAIVADAIGNRALDAGDDEVGAHLAREVAGRLPVPRFSDIGGRTFVRRISCCLVFEVPGCEMCTSCPKRPAAQREQLLAELAARG
ncbi:(2Fe-2S)-binding protein [Nocardia sp. NPDC127526]|uniref:(2Fe-2S)-binding protein n=1 Tax=Nocardia sp. NPDC127526 TaxID=3345393 RepID=UPI00362AC45D